MAATYLSPLLGNHPITTTFGAPDAYSGKPHYAIDWSAPEGTPVYAVGDGVITTSDAKDALGGNIVRLRMPNGDLAGYAHLATRLVSVGQVVHAGQIIGTVGKTGEATTGAHLHFSLDHGGAKVNPLAYLNALSTAGQYDKFVSMFDAVSKSVGTVLVAPDKACPAGTNPGIGPFIGNPIPGWNACIGTPLDTKTYASGFDKVAGTLEQTPVVGQVLAAADFLPTLGTFLFDARNWLRMGALAGGAIMVGVGLTWVVRAT
jgi:hypothetical protein